MHKKFKISYFCKCHSTLPYKVWLSLVNSLRKSGITRVYIADVFFFNPMVVTYIN